MKHTVKRVVGWLLVIVLVLGAALLVRHRRAALTAMPPPAKASMPVATAVAQSGHLTVREHYLGRIQPIHAALLASNVAGDLLDVRGYPGDAFPPGSVLVRIDGRALKEQLATAEAELKSAKRELQIREKVFARYQKLHGDQAVSEEQYDFYKMDRDLNRSKVDRIQAELARAAIQLGYAEISAAFGGVILRRLHEPGENVRAGEPILEVADPAKGYKVVLQVPPAVLKQVAAGTTAYLMEAR